MTFSVLLQFAGPQDGIVHALQARQRGISRRVLRRLVAEGVIRVVHPAVFHVNGVPWTQRSAIRAAVLAGGGLAAAAYSSAAFLLGGAEDLQGRPEIVLGGSVAPELPGVRVHRTRHLPPEDLTTVAGIPTTAGPRTLVDLSGRLSRCERIDLTDRFICARIATRPRVHDRAMSLRRGRPGVGTLVEITAAGADGEFWSALERMFGRQIRQSGLPLPEFNVPLRWHGRRIVVDALWRPQQLVAELHGLRFHDRPADRLHDDERLNVLTHLQLRCLVFGWREVHEDFPSVAEQLSRALGVWV